MKSLVLVLSLVSAVAFAGKSDLEQKPSATPYLHAGKSSVSKGKDKDQKVKGGKGSVKAGPSAAPTKSPKTAQ